MQEAAIRETGAAANTAAPFRNAGELERAVQTFGHMSERLANSYRELERQVSQLSGELNRVSAERSHEVDERERLAGRLRNLLELLPGGVIVLDGAGRVQQCNPAACQILGRDIERARWVDIIREVFAPRGDDGHEVSLRNGRRVGIATASLGREPGQIILLTDLTETRRLQADLSRHQRLSEMGRMVASLAHQVRTPLASALLYCGHLCDSELDESQQRRFALKIRDRLERLERQVRDMLLFARGETGLSGVETAANLVAGVRTITSPLLARAGMLLTEQVASPGAMVRCNRETLVGALVNLVENAMQAGGGGRPIELHAHAGQGTLVLEVRDHGPGIDPARLAQVREPFFTTREHGTGLGLAVVQAVAASHGGRLELESEPGRGLSARIVLPLREGTLETEEVA